MNLLFVFVVVVLLILLCLLLVVQWQTITDFLFIFITRRSKIQRICFDRRAAIENRAMALERALSKSNSAVLRSFALYEGENCLRIAKHVAALENFESSMRDEFLDGFCVLFSRISAYNRLRIKVILFSRETFDPKNPVHIEELSALWKGLGMEKYGGEFSIKSENWKEVGFQSSDPSTDFRGMGMLGLRQLVHFVSKRRVEALSIHADCLKSENGFSFGIAGINVSSWLFNLLKGGDLKRQFYSRSIMDDWFDYYNDLYCVLFSEFKKFWFMENACIMDFEQIAEKFCLKVSRRLKSGKFLLEGCMC